MTLAETLAFEDHEIERVLGQDLDGIWRQSLRDRVGALGGVLGANSLRAGFLLTPSWWRCPACLRDKLEIVRLTQSGTIYCRIVHHHDHTSDIEPGTFHRFGMRKRFATVAMCEDCNFADAKAKKLIGAPDWFSFSPREIGDFCKSKNGERPEPVETWVRSIWKSPLVQEHVALIERAEDWFERYPQPLWERAPLFFAPFNRNSPPDATRPYVQDGYLDSFTSVMRKLDLSINDPQDSFRDFCERSGGSTRG